MIAPVRVAHVGRLRLDSSNGVDKTVAGLIKHLPAAGVEPELWTFTPDVSRVETDVVSGVLTHRVPWHPSRAWSVAAPPRAALEFMRSRAKHVDLLHLHSVYVPANYWAVRTGLPAVLTPNGGLQSHVDRGRRSVLKGMARMTWEGSVRRRVAILHAVSDAEAEQLKRVRHHQPVVTIPNGIDDAALAAAPRPVPHDGVWLYLGRLAVDHKGLDLLLDGYARALTSDPLPRLVLAGPGETRDRRALVAQVRRLGLADHVTFAGPVSGEAKRALVNSAALFVHTSRWDGLPFALLEALAAGRPVLVTPGTNAARYVAAAGAGEVVAPRAADIAAGLQRARAWSASERQARAAAARRLVEDEFRWSSLAEQMVLVYRRLLVPGHTPVASTSHPQGVDDDS